MFCNKQYWRNAEPLLLDCCRNRSIFLFNLVHNQWRPKGATYLCHLALPPFTRLFHDCIPSFSSFTKQEKNTNKIFLWRFAHHFEQNFSLWFQMRNSAIKAQNLLCSWLTYLYKFKIHLIACYNKKSYWQNKKLFSSVFVVLDIRRIIHILR